MRKSPVIFLLVLSVSFFSLNSLLFAEPPHPGGGPGGNPGGNQGHQSGAQHQGMQNQGGSPQHGGSQQNMHQMGEMQRHQGGPGGKMGGSGMDRPDPAQNMNSGMREDHFARAAHADRNQDGHVGPQEANRADQIHDMKMAEHKKDILDKNNDGKIGPKERAWAESQNSSEQELSGSSSEDTSEYTSESASSSDSYEESDTSSLTSSEPSSFQERPLDANGDGTVDEVEKRQAADRNHDGTVDNFEKNLAKEHFDQNQAQMDTPMVQPASFESGMEASSGQGPSGFFSSGSGPSEGEFMARADRNHDGALGPGEKHEALAHMKQMKNDRMGDQNQDGRFDKQERARAQDVMQDRMNEQGFGNDRRDGMQGGPGKGPGEHSGPQGGMQKSDHFGSQKGDGPGGMRGGPQGQSMNSQGGHQGGPMGQHGNMQQGHSGMQGGPGGGGQGSMRGAGPSGNQGAQHGGGPGKAPQGGPGAGGPRR